MKIESNLKLKTKNIKRQNTKLHIKKKKAERGRELECVGRPTSSGRRNQGSIKKIKRLHKQDHDIKFFLLIICPKPRRRWCVGHRLGVFTCTHPGAMKGEGAKHREIGCAR